MTETVDPAWITTSWIDRGREPQCPPNPAYPDGIDVDFAHGVPETCRVTLPYPAPRCGVYALHCSLCRRTWAVTTAGRPDDPRSVRLGCHGITGPSDDWGARPRRPGEAA